MRLPVRHTLIPAALLSLLACSSTVPESLDQAHAGAIRDSVRDMAEAIARDLKRDGPTAWLSYLFDGPEFFMASDGSVAFPTVDSAASFVRGFAPGIADMELIWENIRIEPLSAGAAVVGSSYRETLTDTAGAEVRFGGYFTALAVHTPAGWRLRNLHWSSPGPPTP